MGDWLAAFALEGDTVVCLLKVNLELLSEGKLCSFYTIDTLLLSGDFE